METVQDQLSIRFGKIQDIKNTFRTRNQRKNLHIAPESYIDAYYNTKKQSFIESK